MQKIRKAVFPVAGLGTRFLPATKANPKEMLPIVDKPLIQYAAEEAVAAGCEILVFITGRNQRAIPDHFDKAYELESELRAKGKTEMLQVVQGVLPPGIACVYIRQPEALGLGHAVLCAQAVIGDEPFAVLLADDLIYADERPCLLQMVDIHNKYGGSVLGCQTVPASELNRYGVIAGSEAADDCLLVQGIVEKPKLGAAPSDMAVVGRYILSPKIFQFLNTTARGAGGEIQLTDAIAKLLQEEEVRAFRFQGQRFDCGSKLGYLEATVEYALRHPEFKDEFAAYLQKRLA